MSLKQQPVATQTTTVEVKLKPTTRQMVRQRIDEYVKLARIADEAKARQKRIRGEVEELFVKDKQGKALADGTRLDGYSLKMVCGTTSTLDKLKLMKTHGLTQDDLDDCTETKPNTPYVKITPPKKGGEEE